MSTIHFRFEEGGKSKQLQIARLQDKLTGALIGLARATDGNEHLISQSSTNVIVEGLAATMPYITSDDIMLDKLIQCVEEEKRKMVPNCFLCESPCGRTDDYDMNNLWNAAEDIRSLKSLILFGIRNMACYVQQGYQDDVIQEFFYKALIVIGMDDWNAEELQPVVMELGKMSLRISDTVQSHAQEN